MTALQLIDAAAPGRVLVTGRLPPEGRDLDVLAPQRALESLRHELRRQGFSPRETTWARFEPQELVDLRPLLDTEMLQRAELVAGCAQVCRPDAADALRLLAADFAKDGLLTPSRRQRGSAPHEVWAQARGRGHAAELTAQATALGSDDGTPALGRRVAGRVRRVREAGVIALSGVDGAGKSTQAARLCDVLNAAGIDTVVEWHRLSHDRSLDRIARPVKRLLRPSGARPESDPASEPASEP